MKHRPFFFKPTTEQWHPNYVIRIDGSENKDMRYQEDYVTVTLHSPLDPANTMHRVSVWGADDSGVEFDTPDPFEARNAFFALAILSSIDRTALDLIGPFVPA